ncbi:pyridoxine 5'-phosphate synthase [Phragmitibacter flavus]|uniref:Pyridoxine 5'-phosphate synthase n=1 Tax=Phragmitibacter flavus TaxID=2576071 RepID=A0A5R8KBG3_9BACT|nr:pyridoxine 5'-phosphate synthase [Phragmitibacter flavus]TLD69641.1 pyridoxine 5'-phosphate synthase [Phragmitibacter flavus]
MLHLGVNIDHVATLRQARYAKMPDVHNAEPDLLAAAREVEAAGANSITLHLRADRRHIQDADVYLLKKELLVKLNLEMGNTPEILDIALEIQPDFACLVPENREEITTEGGLDVINHLESLTQTTARLKANGTLVSFFVDPILDHIYAAADCGADMVELHTGTFANYQGDERNVEVARLAAAATLAQSLGLQVNAGHGLTTDNLRDLFAVPHLAELNIGHHLISRSITVGLRRAIGEMLIVMKTYQA